MRTNTVAQLKNALRNVKPPKSSTPSSSFGLSLDSDGFLEGHGPQSSQHAPIEVSPELDKYNATKKYLVDKVPEGYEDVHPEVHHGLEIDESNFKAPQLAGITGMYSHSPAGMHETDDRHVFVKPEISRDARNRPLLDKDLDSAKREALYSHIARNVMGLGEHVPKVSVHTHPAGHNVSTAEFAQGEHLDSENNSHRNVLAHSALKGDLGKLVMMNMLANNVDRHGNNFFVDPKTNKVKLFDNGFSFDYGNDYAPGYIGYSHAMGHAPVNMQDLTNYITDIKDKDLRNSVRGKVSPETEEKISQRLRNMKEYMFTHQDDKMNHGQLVRDLTNHLDSEEKY